MAAIPQKTVLETILEWSENRLLWQRDALRRIVSTGRLDPTDVSDLVELCKQEKGLKGCGLKAEPLAKIHLPANPGQGVDVSLVSIADIRGVNSLAPGQTLTFEQDAIRIICGDNGRGK